FRAAEGRRKRRMRREQKATPATVMRKPAPKKSPCAAMVPSTLGAKRHPAAPTTLTTRAMTSRRLLELPLRESSSLPEIRVEGWIAVTLRLANQTTPSATITVMQKEIASVRGFSEYMNSIPAAASCQTPDMP